MPSLSCAARPTDRPEHAVAEEPGAASSRNTVDPSALARGRRSGTRLCSSGNRLVCRRGCTAESAPTGRERPKAASRVDSAAPETGPAEPAQHEPSQSPCDSTIVGKTTTKIILQGPTAGNGSCNYFRHAHPPVTVVVINSVPDPHRYRKDKLPQITNKCINILASGTLDAQTLSP